MRKKHLKNLLENSPKVTDKANTKIINNQLDIKLGQFTQEELDVVLTKIRSRKAASRWNTSRSIENKEIPWLTAPILQRRT